MVTTLHVIARRKLNFQQLENALGTPLPAVIKGYTTLRDAKRTESSYDKVVMWTGGSCDYDDVVRALVRLDRPEMRPGTSGQNGKTVPTYFTDPEVNAPTIRSRFRDFDTTKQSVDRPHRNEVLDALQEDVDFCEDEETTIARDGAIAIPGVFCITDDGLEAIQENEVPQIIAGSTSFPTSWVPGCPRGSQCCAPVSRFLWPQARCKWQRSGAAHEALEHSTAKTAHEVCKMSHTWTLGSRVSRRESRTRQRREVRSTCSETLGNRCPRGTRRETAT